MPGEFNPNAIDLNVRYGSVRKESLDPEMFPFDWFEFERPPTGSPTYDKHRLKLKDYAVLQATLEGPAFVGLDCAVNITALDIVALDAAGDLIKGDKDALATANVIGFAATTASAGGKCRVFTGGVVDGFVGLNINEAVYLKDDGGHTQTYGDLATGDYVVVTGVAISATEIQVSITQPVLYEKYDGPTYTELQDGYTEGGGTKTPTPRTITRCEGFYKAVVLEWDRQLTLTNLDHYELQVSDDNGGHWYELATGSDWKGTINLNTDVDGEFFVHADLPLAGTSENPLGKRLYYRVRPKTKADAVPAWSAIANTTTLTVQTGDLPANSIYANNIQAGAIKARELSFGSGDKSIPVYEDADAANTAAEIFDLSQPDCVGSRGTLPESGKEVVYAPPIAIDEVLKEFRGFHSPRMIGQSEAIFQTATNLVKSPEDLTTADWTPFNAGPYLTDQYIDGKRLSKVVATAGNGEMQQSIAFTGNAAKAIQILVREGNDATSIVFLYDSTAPATRWKATITWATQTIVANTGSVHDFEWLDDDTVWISGITTSVTAANTNKIGLRVPTNGKYSFFTAVQAENLVYSTPYIDQYRYPTGVRSAVSPKYAVTMPEKFVFKVKIRPWFTYNTAGPTNTIFAWYIDANSRLYMTYLAAGDQFVVVWQDNINTRLLYTETFDDSGINDVNQEIILYGQIDLSTQTGNNAFFAIVAGTKQAEDNDWGGAPDALASTFATLDVGHYNGGGHADSLIEYAKFWTWDGVSLGTLADETDIDRVTADLTPLFDLTLEDYTLARYKPVSKQGAIGVFQKTENLVEHPEDLTDATWLDENANITPSLSDRYIDGKRFTKLLVTDANAAFTYKDVEVTIATPSFQAIFEYGLSTATVINLTERGGATRGTITITWATHTVTAADGATNLEYVWVTDKKVWVAATAAAVVIANDVEMRIYPDTTEANGDHIYATAVMVEDIAYPTPYTPTERAKDGILNYPFEMPEKFSVCFWVRPWFIFSITNSLRLIEWYGDANSRFIIFFDQATKKFMIYWLDNGTSRWLLSQTFDDGTTHDDLNQWIFVAASIDLTTGDTSGSRLKVYADTIGEDTTWTGNIDAKTSSFSTLSVGHEEGTLEADSFISDLMILPNVLLTEEQMDRHYNTRRPWYSASEVASFDRQVRIDRNGIRLHNAELNITDWRNRQILISNRDGLMAKDAAGLITHDIPNAPILQGWVPAGHFIFKNVPTSYSVLYGGSYSNTLTGKEITSTDNIDLSSLLKNLTNCHGAFLHVKTSWVIQAQGAGTKLQDGMNLINQLQYGTELGSVGAYNLSIDEVYFSPPASWPNVHWNLDRSHNCFVPIVHSGGIQYVVLKPRIRITGMTANAGDYELWMIINLMGVFV